MAPKTDPVQTADTQAISLARELLAKADHAALAVTDPSDGMPAISRIAFGLGPDGVLMTLVSSLAAHYPALVAHPACALLVGEVGTKGDPLTHPRLMVKAVAEFVAPDDPNRPALRDHWLQGHPKAKLYIDFADFSFVRFKATSILLNGGFGKAYRLTAAELNA